MKLYELLAVVLLWIASVAGSYWLGGDAQENRDKAKQYELKQAIEDTRKAANQGAADAISKIVVRNTTIQGRVETVVRDNPVYRDCSHDAVGLQLVNQALAGPGAKPLGGGKLSGTDAAH